MSSEQGPLSEQAVCVRNVSKCYRIFRKPQDRLKQVFMWGRKNLFHEFWALHDINFEMQRGEAVGIIGPNGAGKSSILQIIAGTTQPTSGEVTVNGRVAALLELGSGFNPEFTGRENVLMNAAVLGLSRDRIRERYEEIVSFADIGDFIEQPVKIYSTGMVMRLAFAVAVHVDADVLIVDEALSVGDMQFQAKCIAKINQFLQDSRKSLLFVSHGVDAVKSLCRKALFLYQGRQIAFGPSERVCDQYSAMMRAGNAAKPVLVGAGGGSYSAAGQGNGDGNGDGEAPEDDETCRMQQWHYDLGAFQHSWETFSSGKLAPGRYRAIVRTGRSSLGGAVSVRKLEVKRHAGRVALPLTSLKASGGWQLLHSRMDDEAYVAKCEDESLEFEFTGHELTLEAERHSGAGSIHLYIEPLHMPAPESAPAVQLYRPSPEFARRVAALRTGTQQARVMNVELFDRDGAPLEFVPSGEDVIVRLHMMTDIDLDYCNVGCVIRDETGRDLLTVNAFDEQVNWTRWQAGTPRIVEVRFKAALRPGLYTVATGLSHSVPMTAPDAERIFDFCPNAGVFKVTQERSGRPCWGVVRLPASITILA